MEVDGWWEEDCAGWQLQPLLFEQKSVLLQATMKFKMKYVVVIVLVAVLFVDVVETRDVWEMVETRDVREMMSESYVVESQDVTLVQVLLPQMAVEWRSV